MADLQPLVFTIEIDGKPTLSFEANRSREAIELCNEDWLRADLQSLSSEGVPLCSPTSRLKSRRASEAEAEIYRQAALQVKASDDLVLAYLVELDGPE